MVWHAYAVEDGLRVRRLGLRVGVTDIPLTHKSLTVNLARLDVAHAAVAARYPEMLPVRTTCGVVARQTVRSSSGGWLGSQRWRYSWLRESLTVRRARRITGAPIVLADTPYRKGGRRRPADLGHTGGPRRRPSALSPVRGEMSSRSSTMRGSRFGITPSPLARVCA